MTDAAPQKIQL